MEMLVAQEKVTSEPSIKPGGGIRNDRGVAEEVLASFKNPAGSINNWKPAQKQKLRIPDSPVASNPDSSLWLEMGSQFVTSRRTQ